MVLEIFEDVVGQTCW